VKKGVGEGGTLASWPR